MAIDFRLHTDIIIKHQETKAEEGVLYVKNITACLRITPGRRDCVLCEGARKREPSLPITCCLFTTKTRKKKHAMNNLATF